MRALNWAADVVHLGLTVGFGAGQLDAPSKSSNGTFEAYDWFVGLAGTPSTFLILDIIDEIALPTTQISHSQDTARPITVFPHSPCHICRQPLVDLR